MLLTNSASSAGTGHAWRHTSRQARKIAAGLDVPHATNPATFDPAQVDRLPEPARRWLTHAIAPGTTLPAAVELRMHGEIRLDRWRRFTATQALVPDAGFVWAARTRQPGLPISGFDSFAQAHGIMTWRLAGVLPVQSRSDSRVTLSAADRLAAEAVLVPSALIDATWVPGPDEDSATYLRQFGDHHWRNEATVRVAPDGRLTGVSMHRWGEPASEPFGRYQFEVIFDSEVEVDGLRIGDGIRAAWLDRRGRRQEFYRATIDAARFYGTELVQPVSSTGLRT